jgi:hypothetical protein
VSSPNLVSLALQYLTPELIAKIASALGVDRSLIGKAVTAALPALIRSLAGIASKPAGAKQLDDIVSRQSPGILESLVNSLGGARQRDLINGGIETLSSLLGGKAMPALAGALGRFAGLNQESSKSLLGILAPAIIGLLGKQKASQGLDASGMAQLLAAQKDHVSAAMPAEFGSLLKDTNLPGFPDATPGARASDLVSAANTQATKATSGAAWWTWVLPLVVIAALAWWLFGDRESRVVEKPTPEKAIVSQPPATPAQASLMVGDADLGKNLETTFASLKTTLSGISDVATAQTALPNLQSAASEVKNVGDLSGQLPAVGKAALASLIAAARPSLEQLFNKVLAIPGVAEIAKPAIDAIRAQLDALGKV